MWIKLRWAWSLQREEEYYPNENQGAVLFCFVFKLCAREEIVQEDFFSCPETEY